MSSGDAGGEEGYWHYAPRTDEERHEQRKAARLALGSALSHDLSGAEGSGSGSGRARSASWGAADGRGHSGDQVQEMSPGSRCRVSYRPAYSSYSLY